MTSSQKGDGPNKRAKLMMKDDLMTGVWGVGEEQKYLAQALNVNFQS